MFCGREITGTVADVQLTDNSAETARGGHDQRSIVRWILCRDRVSRFVRHNTVPIGDEQDKKKIAKKC